MTHKTFWAIMIPVFSALIIAAGAFARTIDNRTQALESTASNHTEKLDGLEKLVPMVSFIAFEMGYRPSEMGVRTEKPGTP